MFIFMFASFIILHGLVHLLYVGQNQRLFELRPGMTWPDDSWAFSRLFGDRATRGLTSITFILVAIGFVSGGVGLIFNQSWWHPFVVGAAAVSSVMIILLWDGRPRKLDNQGGVGLLINLALLTLLLIVG